MRQINRTIVSALIYSSDEKLLMGRKDPKQGGVYSDCWHIPGGGIDDGENMEEALKREVYEETGIMAISSELIDNIGRGIAEKVLKDTGEKVICNMTFNVFKIQLKKTSQDIKLMPTDDLIELKWFNIEELSNLQITPPSTELFKRLGLIS